MSRTRPRLVIAALAIVTLGLGAGCSDDEQTGTPNEASNGTGTPSESFAGAAPDEIARPPAEGAGVVLPQPAPPPPEGYVQEEYFVAGTATSFDAEDTPEDGTWSASPAEEAEYRTRVIVRRPSSAEEFSGTVLVEWFNVSAIEAAPDWNYLSQEIGREGHAYVGVSAQAQGVEGGETILDVEVDPETAAELDAVDDPSGLKNIDPERYGTLLHPGDAYAFDIFSQVGRALDATPGDLLGELEPEQVLAVGESQSAGFLTTLVNAVHPLDPVFDGFLIHSRGSSGAPLDGDYVSSRNRSDVEEEMTTAQRIRTDLEEPVLMFEAETDLTLLGYARARQPDTDRVRTWEVAGTAHADVHMLRAMLGGPRDPSVGSLLGCSEPINAGPHHEVLQAALHHLVTWSAGGDPPPAAERIELVEGEEIEIARDEYQIALGGVRNPLVDAPVAAYVGDPPGGESIGDLASGEGSVCVLFGSTIPFDQATLRERYGTPEAYLEAFRAAAAEAVTAGFLLQADADELIAEAEGNRGLFG